MDDLDRRREDRPSEQTIRDRLRNRRSLYELHRSMETPSMRLRRTMREEYASRDYPEALWRRHPVKGFIGVSLFLIVAIPVGASLLPSTLSTDLVSTSGISTGGLYGARRDAPVVAASNKADDLILAEKGDRLDSAAEFEPNTMGGAKAIDTQSASADGVALASTTQEETNAPGFRIAERPAASAALPDLVLSSRATSTALSTTADRELVVGSIRPREDNNTDEAHLGGLVTALSSGSPAERMSVDVLRSVVPHSDGGIQVQSQDRRQSSVDGPATSQPMASLQIETSDDARTIEVPVTDGISNDDQAKPAARKGTDIAPGMPSAASTAVANANVNMREKPENEAVILAVLGKGDAVTIVSCDGWCEVVANGTTGYVYGSFLDETADVTDR